MSYKPKDPIYKAEKLYQDDINDLVEDVIEKGGVGSGKRGHTTNRETAYHNFSSEMHSKASRKIRAEASKYRKTGQHNIHAGELESKAKWHDQMAAKKR